MKKPTLSIITAVAVTGLMTAGPALAGVSSSKALKLCENEVTARYGEAAKTKVNYVKKGRLTKVSLKVRGVSERSFKVQCQIDGQQQITLTDLRDNSVAAR